MSPKIIINKNMRHTQDISQIVFIYLFFTWEEHPVANFLMWKRLEVQKLVMYGVPQGSILGAYLIRIKLFKCSIQHHRRFHNHIIHRIRHSYLNSAHKLYIWLNQKWSCINTKVKQLNFNNTQTSKLENRLFYMKSAQFLRVPQTTEIKWKL